MAATGKAGNPPINASQIRDLSTGPVYQRPRAAITGEYLGTERYMPKSRFNGYLKKGVLGFIAALLISAFSAGGAWVGMQGKVDNLVKTIDAQTDKINDNEARIRTLENCINSNIPVMAAELANLKEGQNKLDVKIDRLDYKLDKYNRR